MAYRKRLYGYFYNNGDSQSGISTGDRWTFDTAKTNLSYASNQITLKGGYKYFFHFGNYADSFDADGDSLAMQLYNETTSSYFGSKNKQNNVTSTAKDSWTPLALGYLAPETDTVISVKAQNASGSPKINSAVVNGLLIWSIPDDSPGYQWVVLNMTSDQTGSPLGNGVAIQLEKVAGTLSVSSGSITLKGGNPYLLRASAGLEMTSNDKYGYAQWRREDTSATIGNTSYYIGCNQSTRTSPVGFCEAIIEPVEDLDIHLQLSYGSEVNKIIADRTYAIVERIGRLGGVNQLWCDAGLSENQSSPSANDKVQLTKFAGTIDVNSYDVVLIGGHKYFMFGPTRGYGDTGTTNMVLKEQFYREDTAAGLILPDGTYDVQNGTRWGQIPDKLTYFAPTINTEISSRVIVERSLERLMSDSTRSFIISID